MKGQSEGKERTIKSIEQSNNPVVYFCPLKLQLKLNMKILLTLFRTFPMILLILVERLWMSVCNSSRYLFLS